jgi:UDP-N-acetylmuramoyl-L-alanyl-D-glutamate--2,6-diaminopimelate ligase
MKKLNELISCPYEIDIESVEDDSRVKADNYLFCCIEGLTVDGHDYAKKAVENGAVAVIARKKIDVDVPVVYVKDTNKAMIEILSKFYDGVDKELKMIGITGTDGKTTVASIIYQLINYMDKCGYIGTNGIECSDFYRKVGYTTPFPKELFQSFSDFRKSGCNYVSMEVSSERLLTKRIDNLKFDVAVFTNLSNDHVNNHGTYENYRECKSKLFKMVKKNGYSIINLDDDNAKYFINNAKGKVITYGINSDADFIASDIMVSEKKLLFKLNAPFGEYQIESSLSGRFNVYNIMASIAVCYSLGFDPEKIIEGLKTLKTIKGRADIIESNDFKVIIDYAHTATGLKNLLEYAHIVTKGKIITVTGSAGGKDILKRPAMGEIVTSLSDYVIFTTDDPRYEDPNDIIDELLSKVKDERHNYERIIDRALAIKKALSIAESGDVVVIAGRGNDTFMPVGDGIVRCNDYEEVYKNLENNKIKN